MHDEFDQNGFFVTEPLLDGEQCDAIALDLAEIAVDRAGTRDLLSFSWCGELACGIQSHPLLRPLLGQEMVGVQCTYFEKSAHRNWLVPLHQDLSIPVAAKSDHTEFSGWSTKQGVLFTQPPASVLETLLAVRVHLDDCGEDDGPLRVVPGSHRYGRLGSEEIAARREQFGEQTCTARRGGALIMRPLLLHASSKASANSRRRVLHFVFGPKSLPFGLRWAHEASIGG